ncbi:uncharacterized protein [Eurosta solidaginis]|uniref:uncharacterized protein isoform X1 n=2 Tax=Eurosta solidaginis TaxID=178769 RepID=UPI0035313BA1
MINNKKMRSYTNEEILSFMAQKFQEMKAQLRSLQQEFGGSNPEPSKSNEEILIFMAQHFDELKKTFQKENATLRGQVNDLVKEFAEQKVIIDRLMNKDAAEVPLRRNFPIETEEDLANLNKSINNFNREYYIKTMNIILQPEGILKSMKCILADQLIMDFNVEGLQGKKSLKQYENFYRALLRAIPISETSGPAENLLRDAIKLQKNRVCKNACRKRKYKETL